MARLGTAGPGVAWRGTATRLPVGGITGHLSVNSVENNKT